MRKQTTKDIMKQFGTSYYYATIFFPKKTKKAVMELYKLVRIPDQIVDEIQPGVGYKEHYTQAKKSLQTMQTAILYAMQHNKTNHHKRGDAVKLFRDYEIHTTYINDFFDAMLQDCDIHRYETYQQLQGYMYGSAEVVGLMMCDILQAPELSRPQARLLGEAMQYTNFLRDIYEDYVEYGRIYIPSDRLQQHGLSHSDIISFCQKKEINPAFKAFMRQQITHCRQLYKQANQGIPLLPKYAHLPVLLASKLYETILDKIESVQYNVFAYSARTDKRQKSKVISYHLMNHYICPREKYKNFMNK